MDFQLDRPPEYVGKADQCLPDVIQDLKRVFIKELDSSPYRTLRLTKKNLGELAGVLVEFAEDIHNDIGIWKALEQYNQEFFGARLPFIHQSEKNREQKPFDKDSIWHLLWVVCSELKPQIIFSPIHKDLLRIATIAAGFWADRFTKIPRDSGIKTFLAQPNTYGWDVKKKLVWARSTFIFIPLLLSKLYKRQW